MKEKVNPHFHLMQDFYRQRVGSGSVLDLNSLSATQPRLIPAS
jgi:hypothetical protein